MFLSRPLEVPTIKTSALLSNSLIALAHAIAGSIWPAVPPAANAITLI